MTFNIVAGGPTLSSIALTPANPSILAGATQQFTATGTFSDSSTRDLTNSVTWTATDLSGTNVASISNVGLAAGNSAGTATITATDPATSISGNTTLTVTGAPAPVLTSIAVAPANPSILAGATQQFTATGTFSDNSTRDLTASVTWRSSNAAIATVSDTAPTKGLAAGVAPGGPVTITATDTSVTPNVSGSTTLTVTAPIPVLTSIAVTPANPSILVGTTQQFTATGTFSDNSMQNLTAAVTWTATDPTSGNVASITTSGLATGQAVGTATITATDPSTNINGSTSLTVTTAPAPPPPGVLARVSTSSDADGNKQGNGPSPSSQGDQGSMAVSRNGRYVVFTSDATNLDPGAPNTVPGLFLRDTCLGPGAPSPCSRTTERIAVPGFAPEPAVLSGNITPDGNWIAFTTASNAGTEAGVWVRARSGGAPVRLNASGFDEFFTAPALSDDGRFVAVQTDAALVASDANGSSDIYLFDRDSDGNGTFDDAGGISVKLISETPSGAAGNGASTNPAISADGRFVVYMTSARDIAAGLTLSQEVLLRDATITCSSQPGAPACTTRVSADSAGGRALSSASEPHMSSDARKIVFDVVFLGGANANQVFLATCVSAPGCNPAYELVSVATDGLSMGNGVSQFPWISADGRFVGFESDATNLIAAGGMPGMIGAFVRDVQNSCPGAPVPCSAQTNRVSQLPNGTPSNGPGTHAVVSPDGAFVIFASVADNLDPPDTNFQPDIFIAATGFTPTTIIPNPVPPPAALFAASRTNNRKAPAMSGRPR